MFGNSNALISLLVVACVPLVTHCAAHVVSETTPETEAEVKSEAQPAPDPCGRDGATNEELGLPPHGCLCSAECPIDAPRCSRDDRCVTW